MPLGESSRIPCLAPRSVPSCLAWVDGCCFSPVATISGSDTLIDPHYFQVCGTWQGRRAGGSRAFNYCRTVAEGTASCPSGGYQPFPVWWKTKPIGLSPRSW